MSYRVMATLRGRPVVLVPKQAFGGGLVLEVEQDNRRRCEQDLQISISLSDAQVFLRQWQGAIDEAYRREKEAAKALRALALEAAHG